MESRTFKRHDLKGTPWVRLLERDGTPLNLTNCTCTYTLQNMQTGLNKVFRATATVRDQTVYPGEVFYQFTAPDVDTEMYTSEEWEVIWPDGKPESFPVGDPVGVYIQADLDNT